MQSNSVRSNIRTIRNMLSVDSTLRLHILRGVCKQHMFALNPNKDRFKILTCMYIYTPYTEVMIRNLTTECLGLGLVWNQVVIAKRASTPAKVVLPCILGI